MMFSRYDLLPPNATRLERDFSQVISSFERIRRQGDSLFGEALFFPGRRTVLRYQPQRTTIDPVSTIRTAKRINIPSSVVPWLIWEYGLGEILPYLPDMRQALAQGIAWQRIRGTPQSITLALSWIGITGVVEESEANTYRWAEYQLGLSAPTQGDAIIDQIAGVTRISNPVRSRLQRIYAVYDLRRAVYDQCSWSDGTIYSDHSGVRPRPDWPQISYGQFTRHLVEEGTQAYHCLTDVYPVLVEYQGRFRYDEDTWSEGWHDPNLPGTITETIGQSSGYIGQSWAAFAWRDVSWADAGPIVHDANWETVPSTTATWIPGLGAVGVQSDSADLG